MGSSNSKQKEDPKLDTFVAFLIGLVDDGIVTDEEFEELERYKRREGIDNEMYLKALKKLGLTIKDVLDMRETKTTKKVKDSSNSEKKEDSKLTKLVDFLYEMVDDGVMTVKELKELDEYKERENIDTETYMTALKKLGLTVKDIIDMRENKDAHKKVVTKYHKKPKSTDVKEAIFVQDNRSAIIHHHHHHHEQKEKHKKATVYGYLVRCNSKGNPVNTFTLTRDTTTIGRDNDNHIRLPKEDLTVSRKHAIIRVKKEKHSAYIFDIKSTSGTKVKHKAITTMEKVPIESGDVITIGESYFIFFHADEYKNRKRKEPDDRKETAGPPAKRQRTAAPNCSTWD